MEKYVIDLGGVMMFGSYLKGDGDDFNIVLTDDKEQAKGFNSKEEAERYAEDVLGVIHYSIICFK